MKHDPQTGKLPWRATDVRAERVLHLHLRTLEEPQASLLAAVQALAGNGYEALDWIAVVGPALAQTKLLHERFIETARSFKPTLIFMQIQQPNVITAEVLRAVREAVGDPQLVIAHWSGDVAGMNGITPECLGWQLELANECDLWLHSSWSHVLALRVYGVRNARYLQIGFCADRYTPQPTVEKRYDVAFLGQNYPPKVLGVPSNYSHTRAQIVQAFIDSGLRFALYGSNWPEPNLGRVPPASSADVYRSSHLGLNASISNIFERYSSDRLLRIMACGVPPLVERFPDTASWGLVHAHNCLLFDTPSDAVEQARMWLDRIDELRAIGDRARQHVVAHHTWGVRMLELIPYIADCRGEEVEVYVP